MQPQKIPSYASQNLQQNQNNVVQGLHYIDEFITFQEEQTLIKAIRSEQWNLSLKRRTQHYGFEYGYDRKKQLKSAKPIPIWATKVKSQLQSFIESLKIFDKPLEQPYKFDQVIVNEYLPGQGISPHVDDRDLFQDVIVSLSLASDTTMQFMQKSNSEEKVVKEIRLKRRSILILSDEARNQWKHSIPARKSDQKIARDVRWSVTFRKVKAPNKNL